MEAGGLKMNTMMRLLTMTLVLAGIAIAGEMPSADKTLSPYFMVKSDQPGTDQLPLLSTSADVSIAGVIADVRVTQVYKNDGKRPIEAIYVFPASTRAAVYSMKMTIGDRTITAEIREREQARQDYEDAKQAGKSASLLEQERPNVFQMNVANIMPGDRIKVEMNYTELLVPVSGIYEFDYPTVVGPRYSNQSEKTAPENDKWVASPYQHESEAPLYTFDMKVALNAGLPIKQVICPSHKTNTAWHGMNTAVVSLDKSEAAGGNRDFILKYQLAGGKIESGLLLYEGREENFFLLMMQPPKRVENDAIPPREYIFVIDVSGSMHGYPLDISKKLMRDLLVNLRSSDYFNVLFFAGGNSVLSEQSLPVTGKNIEIAVAMVENQRGGGGTELLPAMKRALELPRAKGTSRSVVIATDGYVNVEAEAFDLIREKLGKANFFAFGIGSSVNRFIIEGMAHVGMGEPFVVTDQSEAPAQAEKFRNYIQSPVLTQIEADFGKFEVYDVEPPFIPDVLAERPIIVFGKWRGPASGTIGIKGFSGSGKYSSSVKVGESEPDEANSALRYLWARHRIQFLSDYNNLSSDDKRVKEVTNLGLKYNLLTAYTSFIAIDAKVRNVGGKQEVVKQALPLPQGVSDYAVGGEAGAMRGYGGGGMGLGKSSGAVYSTRAQTAAPAPTLSLEDAKKKTEVVVAGTVDYGDLEIRGGLTEEVIASEFDAVVDSIEAFYGRQLLKTATLSGKIVVKFVIDPDGGVGKVTVESNELNKETADRLVKLIKTLRFKNLARTQVTVTAPFIFTR
jgi:Ca-activated chloride channel family protein